MQITDSIGDMLTRIRNANSAKHETVSVPASNMKKAIAQILVDEGYIKSFKVVEDGKQGIIEMDLKYGPNKSSVITGIRRVSKPGLRIYTNCEDMPKVMKGLGVAILSTSKGVMTDRAARKANVGARFSHSSGKEVSVCQESANIRLPFPLALTLLLTAVLLPLRAPRVLLPEPYTAI